MTADTAADFSSRRLPRLRARSRRLRWPLLALVALSIATFVGFLIYPTYPNYDSYYSLLWGKELLSGQKLSFEAYYAPTEHPLAIAFGAVLSLIGRGGDRVMVFCTLAAFVLLCAGLYRLGRLLFTPLIGALAVLLLVTRFDFPFLAARAYIDIPYLALIIWAAALEAARPRRGGPVWALLICAGLLRPEAWLLLGLYGLWLAVGRLRQRRSLAAAGKVLALAAAIASIAPLIWFATDYAVTGDPLFSLTHTSSFAEELGRTKGAGQIPSAMGTFFLNLTKLPVLIAGVIGFLVGLWLVPRRITLPTVLWLIGVGTFVLIGIAGLSVIDRYLLVPALMVMMFAAVAIGGFTMLESGILRKIWATLALLGVIGAIVFTVTRVNLGALTAELSRRGVSHVALVELLDRQAVARSCRPLSAPNHKLVPEIRWVAGLGERDVLARTQATGADNKALPAARRATRSGIAERLRDGGTALFVAERVTLQLQAMASSADDIFNNLPVYIDGRQTSDFVKIAGNRYYAAYARCDEDR